MTEDELAAVAAQLVARVRNTTREENAEWLVAECPDPADWFRLAFALAAAVEVDRPFSVLIGWARLYEPTGNGRPDTAARVQRRRYDLASTADDVADVFAEDGSGPGDRLAAVEALTNARLSTKEIGKRLGVSGRQVQRDRARLRESDGAA